jgi:hypothetical protein
MINSCFLSKVPQTVVMNISKDKLSMPGPGAYDIDIDVISDTNSKKSDKKKKKPIVKNYVKPYGPGPGDYFADKRED